MNTLTVALSSFVDRALLELQGPSHIGAHAVMSSALTSATSSTTFTVTNATQINVSDLVEVGSELMLVTNKTSDATPVITVSRAYYGSVIAAHASGEILTINPAYPRVRVGEAVRRSFSSLEAAGLPLTSTGTYQRVTNYRRVLLPANTRDVLRVSYIATDGRWVDIPMWDFIDDVPTTLYPTGKILKIPSFVMDGDDLQVTIRIPYRWSSHPTTPGETDTITILEGAEDLPSVFAAAWLIGAREISRQQLERAEEWNQAEPGRGGVSLSLLRGKWQDFYRRIDECKHLYTPPVHRPYRKTPKV